LDGYRGRSGITGLPSVPIFAFIAAVILFFYSEGDISPGLPVLISSITFLLLFSLLLYSFSPLILRNGMIGVLFTAFFSVLLFSIVSSLLYLKISERISLTALPDEIDSPVVTITEQRLMRTGIEYYFNYAPQEGGEIRGYLFVQGSLDISSGDTVLIHKVIKRSDPVKGNSFLKKLYREGVHFRVYAFPDDITLISKGESFGERAKNVLLSRIGFLFPAESSGLIKALYSGNRNYISSRVVAGFRDSGILHVLAASGLHVGIIASIPMIFLFMGFDRKFLLGCSLVLVLSYFLVTDMPVSLFRASVMFGVVYMQILLNRPVNPLNSLFIAGSVILLVMPWEIYSAGFQLSFGATAGIIMFYRGYAGAFSSFPPFFRDSFAVTLAAQSVTAPVIFYHMEQINLASLPANLAAIPLITAVMITSLTALVISPFSSILGCLTGEVTHFFYKILVTVTDIFSAMSLNYYTESVSVLLPAAFILSLTPILNFKKIRRFKLLAVAVSIIIAFAALERSYPEDLKSIIISSGGSSVEVYPGEAALVKLMIKDQGEGRMIFDYFRKSNINPLVVEMEEYSFPNIRFCRRLLTDYRVDELIINEKIAAAWGMDEIYMLVDGEKINLTLKKIKN